MTNPSAKVKNHAHHRKAQVDHRDDGRMLSAFSSPALPHRMRKNGAPILLLAQNCEAKHDSDPATFDLQEYLKLEPDSQVPITRTRMCRNTEAKAESAPFFGDRVQAPDPNRDTHSPNYCCFAVAECRDPSLGVARLRAIPLA
jgi:hypothetical protein